MANDKNRQEEQTQYGRKERQQVPQHVTRNLFRTGVGLACLPINLLPQAPQHHFKATGREGIHGKPHHDLADIGVSYLLD